MEPWLINCSVSMTQSPKHKSLSMDALTRSLEKSNMLTIPTTLTAKSTNVTWLNIEGPIAVMRELDAWMAQEHISPIYACGGSFGPFFINGAFPPNQAQLVMDKIADLKLKMNQKECAS